MHTVILQTCFLVHGKVEIALGTRLSYASCRALSGYVYCAQLTQDRRAWEGFYRRGNQCPSWSPYEPSGLIAFAQCAWLVARSERRNDYVFLNVL